MAELELIIAEQEVTIPQAIENLETLKKDLAPMLEKYSQLIVSEDGITDAKADRAKLNKLKAAIDDRRKDAKNQIMTYYKPLEEQCKSVIAMIDTPISKIDEQLKSYDDKYKSDKLLNIKTAFYKIDKPEWLEFNSVCPPKWDNKTAKIEKVIEEMTATVERIKSEIADIKADFEEQPYYAAIVREYKSTLDKSKAYEHALKLARDYEEYKKQKATESTPNSSAAEIDVITPPQPQTVNTSVAEPVLYGTFRVMCKKSQLINLREYMKSNGIDFEIVI